MPATVPSTSPEQQNTAAGGVDIISQLITSAREADTRSAEASKAASIPITGGHQQPQSVVSPGAGHGYRQQPLDNSRVYGHHQATMQGIANLSKSVANVVGQVQQDRDQKKTQELSVNIEHLMGAINSADQAKQVLSQDPNNQAAQDQLKKAQAIQAEVLNDDKNRKAIGKAFNINFTDPSKNNTPEHAALKQATDSYAKQFSDKLPSNMAPNPQAVAQAQIAAAEAKATHDLVDKLAPAIVAAESRQSAANTRAAAEENAAKTRYEGLVYSANQHYQAAIKGANIHVKGMLEAVRMRDQALIDVAQKKIDALSGVDGKTPKAQQEAQRAFDSISKALDKMPTTIDLLRQERDKIQKENSKSPQLDFYNKRIHFLESQGLVLEAKQEELADRLSKAGGTPVDGSSDSSAASGADSPTYIADGDDDPDEYDQ